MIPDPRVVPFLPVPEAGALIGLGRSASYDMARRFLATGVGLPAVQMGRSLFVPTAKLRALAGLPTYDPEDETAERRAAEMIVESERVRRTARRHARAMDS